MQREKRRLIISLVCIGIIFILFLVSFMIKSFTGIFGEILFVFLTIPKTFLVVGLATFAISLLELNVMKEKKSLLRTLSKIALIIPMILAACFLFWPSTNLSESGLWIAARLIFLITFVLSPIVLTIILTAIVGKESSTALKIATLILNIIFYSLFLIVLMFISLLSGGLLGGM